MKTLALMTVVLANCGLSSHFVVGTKHVRKSSPVVSKNCTPDVSDWSDCCPFPVTLNYDCRENKVRITHDNGNKLLTTGKGGFTWVAGPSSNFTVRGSGRNFFTVEGSYEIYTGNFWLCNWETDPASPDGNIPAGLGIYYVKGTLTIDLNTFAAVKVKGSITPVCPLVGP